MSGLFSSPKAPAAPAAPTPAPTMANTDTDIVARQQALALQRGRTALALNATGDPNDVAGSTKKRLFGM